MKNLPVDLISFEWAFDEAGYDLVSGRGVASSALLGRERENYLARRKGGPLRKYRPRAEVPALHRLFVGMADTPEAMLEFVAARGFLGVGAFPRSEQLGRTEESFDYWVSAKRHMGDVLGAFDAAEQFDQTMKRMKREREEEGKTTEPMKPARRLIAGLFNQWVEPHLSIKIEPVDARDDESALALKLVPRSLLGFMWFQVAQEIAGGVQWRACKRCGKPFYIGEGGARRDRETCSDSCRVQLSKSKTKPRAKP